MTRVCEYWYIRVYTHTQNPGPMKLLEKVCSCFNQNNIPYAIVGGYALALHGAPRGTIDIDFIISFNEEIFLQVEASLVRLGFQCRLPLSAHEVFKFRKEYIEKRNLITWSFYNPHNPMEVIDIIITENVDNVQVVEKQLANLRIKVISKADLILMKKKTGRKQDEADVAALESL